MITKTEHIFLTFLKSLDYTALQSAQSLIFAIEEINKNSSLLPGVLLGYKIFDTCGSETMGIGMAMALMTGNIPGLDEPCTKSAQVQAIIGEAFSSVSMAIAKSIGPFSIPLVSTYAMSIKNKYSRSVTASLIYNVIYCFMLFTLDQSLCHL